MHVAALPVSLVAHVPSFLRVRLRSTSLPANIIYRLVQVNNQLLSILVPTSSSHPHWVETEAMDEARFAQLLEQQKRTLDAAKGRRGQRATNKASRLQLLSIFTPEVSRHASLDKRFTNRYTERSTSTRQGRAPHSPVSDQLCLPSIDHSSR